MDHQDFEILGRRKGKFNPQIFLNKKVFEIDNAQFKLMQKMDVHDVSKLVLRILKKAIANRENDDVTVLYFYFKDSTYIQKLQNKFDEQTLLQIISHTTYRKFTRHEAVCTQGRVDRQMYFILEGKACTKSFAACEYQKKDGTVGIRKVCLSSTILSRGDHFCQEILKGKNYDESKNCLYSVNALDQILECAVLRRDHFLGFKISMEIKLEIHKVNLIQSSSIFNYHLNPRQLKALSQNFHLKKSYCNNIIYNEGEEADSIYIIKSGRFKLQKFTNFNYNFDELDVTNFKMAQAKKYSEVAILGEGQCFGDEEILKNIEKRIFTVSCETASSELFVIQKKDFFRVLSSMFKEEDWKEMENAFQIKNDWRKENITSIEKVKHQYVDYVAAPPKYSGEAKFLKITRNTKKSNSNETSKNQLKILDNQAVPSILVNESPKTFLLTQAEDQVNGGVQEFSHLNTSYSNSNQQKTDLYLYQKDITLTCKSNKIQTDLGFYHRKRGGSSKGVYEESEDRTETNSSQPYSNAIQNTAGSRVLKKYRDERIPSHLRSQSVQDDNNLLKLGTMISSKNGQIQNMPLQNSYPHQKELILPEINYKEHSTIDVRHRHPSPWSSLTKRQKENSFYRNAFYSGMSSPTQNQYNETNSKRTPYKRPHNTNGSLNSANFTSTSISDQYNEQNKRNQSPTQQDEMSINNNVGSFSNNIEMGYQLPLKRMDVGDILHNKAIILKTKNFTNEDEKGRIIAFEGAHFIPTELDNAYLEKKGIIKKKYDPKKREQINQQSMEKGKKILENFILGYLTKKKKVQSNKRQNEEQENNDGQSQMRLYNFPQGKTNNQFYQKSNRNKFQRRINTNTPKENSLSPIPPQSQDQEIPINSQLPHSNNGRYYNYRQQKSHQIEFSPIQQPKIYLKENSNQLVLNTLEKSPTKLSIQDSIRKNRQSKQGSIQIDQQRKQSLTSILVGGKNISDIKNQIQEI